MPRFSVVMPVYRPDLDHFQEAVASVRAQSFGDWELVAALDGEQPDGVRQVLEAPADPRIVIVDRATNGGIAAASQSALDRSQGDFIALLDQDDTLAPFALAANAECIDRWPDADVLYSDEDKIGLDGRREEPFCKPAFSPERLRSHMYLGHLGVYRRELVVAVGGFRSGFDGSQDHDLALRTTERARRVVHIPRVLYHWRRSEGSTAANPESKTWAYDAGVRAVQSHLDRTGIEATASRGAELTGVVDIEPALTSPPLASIVVPTAGGRRLVHGEDVCLIERCLESIRDRSTYPDFEVVVVIDRNADTALEQRLQAIDPEHVRTIRNRRPFNFSEACNLGRDHARGRVLVLLNDDTEVETPNWLERLVLFATLDGVGVVGAKLLYGDGRIQHAGLLCRNEGVGHRFVGCPGGMRGQFEAFAVQSNVLAVTGACLAVDVDRFDQVGGLSAAFPLAFNDVDFCLKLHRRGYRNVYDPATVVIHHESSSRNPDVTDSEMRLLFERWRPTLHDEPYDHPAMHVDGFEQFQPPIGMLLVNERLGIDSAWSPRPWPLDGLNSGDLLP